MNGNYDIYNYFILNMFHNTREEKNTGYLYIIQNSSVLWNILPTSVLIDISRCLETQVILTLMQQKGLQSFMTS